MAMRKEKLWNIFIKNNPQWETKGANLTPNSIKKLFDQTFEKVHELGLENGKVIEQKKQEKEKKNNPLSGLFG